MAYWRSRSRGRYGNDYGGWRPYVPVAKRRSDAVAHAKNLEKQRGRPLTPIQVEGRAIATSFWGKAWCENLEAYSDFANRLPRGRSYLRNGSVIDLEVTKGKITALVSGSEIYELTIAIDTLPSKTWKGIQGDCARSIASLIDLLQGRFDRGVMERLTQKESGLFPKPKEIKLKCSCPDSAGMCKHLAAVMYGIGARLDQAPELLFTLRNVDHLDLISQAVTQENLDQAFAGNTAEALQTDDLGQLFGIELEMEKSSQEADDRPPKGRRKSPAATKAHRKSAVQTSASAKPAAKKRASGGTASKRSQSTPKIARKAKESVSSKKAAIPPATATRAKRKTLAKTDAND